jgi:hypothetical protein
MFSKKIAALVAGAFMVATSSAAVRAAPLAGAALMQSGGEESGGASTATILGVSFALIAGAVLIADSGGNEEPVSR